MFELDLFNKSRREGRSDVSRYFENYQGMTDWRLTTGMVEGRPAILVMDPENPEKGPIYFVVLEWADGRIVTIRDFRYARYAITDAELTGM